MVRWVAFEVSLGFMLKFKPFKMSVTAIVSFNLIAILVQRVKSHFLQETNLLIVDRHIQNNMSI